MNNHCPEGSLGTALPGPGTLSNVISFMDVNLACRTTPQSYHCACSVLEALAQNMAKKSNFALSASCLPRLYFGVGCPGPNMTLLVAQHA